MAITPDALAQARMGLRSAFRDEALADRFIAIRGYGVRRSAADQRATLTDGEIQVLQSLIARSSPSVQVTTNVERSRFPPGGTRAEMVFQTTFRSNVQPAPPFRVIRFVRAAQFNRLFGSNKVAFTVPGYVCYRDLSNTKAAAPGPQNLHASLMRAFTMSKWSFDGPRKEFEGGGLTNKDTPGTMYSDLPYGIMADFLIALYDERTRNILEVGRAAGWVCVWQDNTHTFVRTR